VKSIVAALIPLVVVTLTLEILVRDGVVKSYLLPAPSSVAAAMIHGRQPAAGGLVFASTVVVCEPVVTHDSSRARSLALCQRLF